MNEIELLIPGEFRLHLRLPFDMMELLENLEHNNPVLINAFDDQGLLCYLTIQCVQTFISLVKELFPPPKFLWDIMFQPWFRFGASGCDRSNIDITAVNKQIVCYQIKNYQRYLFASICYNSNITSMGSAIF